MITLKHLQIFVEVAKTCSMSKAANHLFVSQPTISQKIADIENYYDIKLFERYSKTLCISEEGKRFLEYATRVLMEMDKLDHAFLNHDDLLFCRIGATMTIGSSLFPQLISSLQNLHPDMQIKGYVDNTEGIEKKILNNELDIGLVEGITTNPHIISEPIIQDCLVVICGKKHPFTKRKVVTREDLRDLPFVMREEGSGTRNLFEHYMQSHNIPFNVVFECRSWDGIKQAIKDDVGLALISVRLIEKELDEGSIHIVNIKDCMWRRNFSLCYHKNKSWTRGLDKIHTEINEFAKIAKLCPAHEMLIHAGNTI